MATNPIKLAIDRQTKTLIQFPGFAISIPDLFQSNTVDFEVQSYDTPGITAAPPPVDLAAYGLRMAIGDTPTGTAGGPAPFTTQTAWTWDSVNKKFVGSIALNVAAIDTFLGPAAQKTAYLEINLTIAGTRITILQTTFLIKAVVDEGTSTVPTPTDSYMTKNEVLATFVKKVSDPGEVQVKQSPDGTSWGVEIGVNNDGTVSLNAIKLT